MIRVTAIFCALAALPVPAAALELELPVSARLTAERVSGLDSFDAPVAAFDGAGVPSVTIEGRIERRAWRIGSPGLTPLQVMLPFRAQLEAMGFDIRFECAASACGGFDFRFETEVLPAPNMYVDITAYRYLTALRGAGPDPEAAVGILASVTAQSAYVQIITAEAGVAPGSKMETDVPDLPEAPVAPPSDASDAPAAESLAAHLLTRGNVILPDLDFAHGTSDLGQGPFASLDELAALLTEQADLRIALVGHTDTTGGLSANLVISRDRARSVRARLVENYGLDPERIEAEGIGYLAPVASNRTEEGRSRNRRVEVILLNTE